jgi:AcrR family transcriptional regulator
MAAAAPASRRADAARNRARLVDAARELFRTEGLDVSIRQIAASADVGLATLYRHFPTRDALVDAVLEDSYEEYIAVADRALDESDAWLAFTGFVERVLELQARNRGLRDIFERRGERTQALRRRARPVLSKLIKRAQDEGGLRGDFEVQDLALLFWSCDRIIERTAGVAPEVWRRQIGFLMDGLRAESATPLAAPALRESQLARVGSR